MGIIFDPNQQSDSKSKSESSTMTAGAREKLIEQKERLEQLLKLKNRNRRDLKIRKTSKEKKRKEKEEDSENKNENENENSNKNEKEIKSEEQHSDSPDYNTTDRGPSSRIKFTLENGNSKNSSGIFDFTGACSLLGAIGMNREMLLNEAKNVSQEKVMWGVIFIYEMIFMNVIGLLSDESFLYLLLLLLLFLS